MINIFKIILSLIIFSHSNFLIAGNKDSLATAKTITPVSIFNDTRVINGHSTDMLWKNEMDIRIAHRFGDMGTTGSAATAFGLDNAADIRIAIEYGLFNKLNIGLARCKGAGPFSQIGDGFLKYNIIQQNEEKTVPLSITFLQTMAYTFMKESTDSTLPSSFNGVFTRRLAYSSQLLIGRKFGQRLGIIISPTYVHRNYVAFEDKNGLFSIGASVRLRVTKIFSLITEYYYNFRSKDPILGIEYQNPLGIGFEFDTGGHLFMLNFTNSAGLGETQFIPYTASKWTKGQFRMGFTISRIIKFKQH